MSDEVTVTEAALVLQEIDESDVLVKESVLAYLMWHSGYVLNSAYPDSPEFRAEIIDEFAESAVNTIRSDDNKIGDAMKEAIRISKRVLAMKSMRTQGDYDGNPKIYTMYLDVGVIRSGALLPESLADNDDFADITLSTPDVLTSAGLTFDSYKHFRDSYVRLGDFLIHDGKTVLYMLEHLQDHFLDFADERLEGRKTFHSIKPEWLIIGAPGNCTRDIGDTDDDGYLTRMIGQVIEVSDKLKIQTHIAFRCMSRTVEDDRCLNVVMVPQNPEDTTLATPRECPRCSGKAFSKLDSSKSRTEKIQKLLIQETEVSDDDPRTIPVELRGSLVDAVKAGSVVEVTGILRLEAIAKNSTLCTTYLSAKSIEETSSDSNSIEISSEDIAKIQEFAIEKSLEEKLDEVTRRWAGHLVVNKHIKRAIILQACGASMPDSKFGHRENMHILIVGDPGTAKTKLLEAGVLLRKGSRYADATNISQAGLTGGCEHVEDLNTGKKRWAIQPGEFTLTSATGIFAVDEFNLYKGDYGDFNTGMESGIIPIKKIIKATLPAKAAVLAGANPSAGNRKKFSGMVPFVDEIGMDFPQLQRFDLIFVLQDKAEKSKDRNISMSMLGYGSSSKVADEEYGFVLKLIEHCRTFSPDMSVELAEYISDRHADRRQNTKNLDYMTSHREVGAIRRVAVAAARFDMSDKVTMAHVKLAEEIISESLIEKDIGAMTGDVTSDKREDRRTLAKALGDYVTQHSDWDQIPTEVLMEHVKNHGIDLDKKTFKSHMAGFSKNALCGFKITGNNEYSYNGTQNPATEQW